MNDSNSSAITRRRFMKLAVLGTAGIAVFGAEGCGSSNPQGQSPDSSTAALDELAWWQKTIAYECYPKSFQDTGKSGMGTLKGITSRLDYLASFGVGALWLTPVYDSPQKDNGYDVADYKAIWPQFGTMDDMDELIAEADKRGIKIVTDLVFNHTSEECAWFKESRSSRDNAKADWYIWRDGKTPGAPDEGGLPRTTGGRSSGAALGAGTIRAPSGTYTRLAPTSPTSTGKTPTCAPPFTTSPTSDWTKASGAFASMP